MPLAPLLPAVKEFLARPAKMLIGGEWVDAGDGRADRHIRPGHRASPSAPFPMLQRPTSTTPWRAARRAFKGPWRKITPYERGRLLQKCRGAHRKARRRTRAAHHARKRQAALGGQEGSRDRRKLDRILRRLDDEAARRDDPASRCRASFSITPCASRSASSPGITPPNYPLTMPLYKAAPGAGHGQHDHHQAVGGHVARGDSARRNCFWKRASRGRVQCRHRLRRNRRRRARQSRRRRQDHLHRLDRSGPPAREGRRRAI